MRLYSQQYFHIYNQGNNRRQLFYRQEHYEFFLWKMRAYLLPFGDLIAYCLMPNHYHWFFYVKHVEIDRKIFREHIDSIEWKRRKAKYKEKARAVENNKERTAKPEKPISLNESIGYLQRSYTRAINLEKDWSGSLFRRRFKVKDDWVDEFVTIEKNGRSNPKFGIGNDYAYKCLCYIHDNPVKARLVDRAEDWTYSSAKDYAGQRSGSLCNIQIGRKILNFM